MVDKSNIFFVKLTIVFFFYFEVYQKNFYFKSRKNRSLGTINSFQSRGARTNQNLKKKKKKELKVLFIYFNFIKKFPNFFFSNIIS